MQNNDILNVNTSKSNENQMTLSAIDKINYNIFDTESQVRQYAEHMRNSAKIRKYNILSLRGLGKDKKADDVQSCAAYILYKEKETTDGEFLQKIDKMYLCKDRFCMFCAGVKAAKNLRILIKTFDKLNIENDNGIRYRFITLTVPNVDINNLRNQIQAMTKAFNSLNARYKKAGLWNGYYKSLEITYNEKNNTYHPHLHIIADGIYIPQDELSRNWYNAAIKHGIMNIPKNMNDNKKLNVHIQATIKPWELCKYVVKPDTMTYAAIYDLINTQALKGFRDYGTAGTIKKTMSDIKKECEIIKKEEKQKYNIAKYIRAIEYLWNGFDYERRQ